MGWCFGGGVSLQLALNEKLAATVIYYVNSETNKEKLKVITWPVLGIFGEKFEKKS
ncbi:MAG: dienelactone hydrolase family protein [Nanoarchaeota archaeon]